ncbi:glycosyltransferase [Paraburkholderia diazotrophica]|uniref:Membrane protein involved in the export of O-antigen and teichoic acid n=1 Tax=Paraburkholderia diazotrophica TaxID=667676 RepID=A0A1H7E8P8_9BURK|nr:glycosyltransferase [Paraburkholderia diazotrophica]SEK06965.1 Membrane protein involved in the export of O-antigen and teichoic acid [Paraburkholderia diazotrophica]
MTSRRDVWSLAQLLLGAGGSAAVAFVVQAALARAMSAEVYGHFAAALATLSMIAPAVGFGLPVYWLKLYGSEGQRAKRWMPASTRFISISGLVCLGVTAAWALFASRDAQTKSLILCMLPVVLSQAAIELNSAKYQLEGRYGLLTIWQLAQHVVRLVVILYAQWLGWRAQTVAFAFGAIGLALAVGACWTLWSMRTGRIRLEGHDDARDHTIAPSSTDRPGVLELCAGAMPFGVASVLYFAYAQSGLFVVAHLLTAHEAAEYSVAVAVLSATYLIPTVVFQRLLLPRFHRWVTDSPERLERAWRKGNGWMLVAGTAIGVAVATLAPFAIPLVFGQRYKNAVDLIVPMAVCIPLRFVATSSSSAMTTSHLIGVRNGCSAAVLFCGVAAFGLLIPRFGLEGAVFATVAGEALWTVLSLAAAKRFLPRRDSTQIAFGTGVGHDSQFAVRERAFTEFVPVTVIVPCYNCATTIERAVASVARQTCRPVEVILVDDCSNEETAIVLSGIQNTYGSEWVRVMRQAENAGPGAARNAAWGMATQPYIAFLDSDDAWHPQKIAIQYGWMRFHPDVAISGHPVEQLSESNNHAMSMTRLIMPAQPRQVSRFHVLFSNRFTPSSVMVRGDVAARFDERKRHAEDYFMLLELVLVEAGTAFLFPSPLSYVFKRQFGASSGLSAQLWKIQKGEQHNYLHFWRAGAVSFPEWMSFSVMSFAKYLRRCTLSGRFA